MPGDVISLSDFGLSGSRGFEAEMSDYSNVKILFFQGSIGRMINIQYRHGKADGMYSRTCSDFF